MVAEFCGWHLALGHIDFAGIVYNHFNREGVEETDAWGMIPKSRPEFNTPGGMPLWAMEVYYRFLNCGFRLPVSAGSASGVKAAPLTKHRRGVRLRDCGDLGQSPAWRQMFIYNFFRPVAFEDIEIALLASFLGPQDQPVADRDCGHSKKLALS
jgi:hypothetical protein